MPEGLPEPKRVHLASFPGPYPASRHLTGQEAGRKPGKLLTNILHTVCTCFLIGGQIVADVSRNSSSFRLTSRFLQQFRVPL